MINLDKFEEKLEKEIHDTINRLDDQSNRFDIERNWSWNAKTKEEYYEIKAKFEGFEISNEFYEISCWCDESSFEYWVNDVNYINITFEIKNKFTYIHNYDVFVKDLLEIISKCESIEEKFMKTELWNQYVKEL